MTSNLTKVDFNQGLRHCDGLQDLYREVLMCYLEQFRPLLDDEVLLDDVENARLQLHTLKSLSATIGAAELSQLAAQLFKQWQQKSQHQRKESIKQINAHLEAVNGKVESYCKEIVASD